MSAILLQLVRALYPQSESPVAQFTWELACQLGGAVVSFTPLPPGATPPPEWQGLRVFTPAVQRGGRARQSIESPPAVFLRALDATTPAAAFVQDLGALSPALLLSLRERGIPYAVFLHDFTPLCPTQRLWHRRQEPCSGPGRTGWKCAWCVSGTWGRAAELPLRTLLYRHRPRDWRTALVRADALITPSRFARDFWVDQGAPPERIAVCAPCLPPSAALPSPASSLHPAPHRPPQLVYAGGDDLAQGRDLLAAALERLRAPVHLQAIGALAPPAQARLRQALPSRHPISFPGPLGPAALDRLLRDSQAAVDPARWQQPYSRLLAAAQAAGVPVAATASGGCAEQIIHGVNGFLADPDDPQALAEALLEALSLSPAPAWAAARIAVHARLAAQASLAALRRLLDLLATGATSPEPALQLEHGDWLRRLDTIPEQEPAQALTEALRQPEAATPAYAARALACGRQWLLNLYCAIAFLRACGCARVALLGDPAAAGDLPTVISTFAAWGLGPVPVTALPDGLWQPEAVEPSQLRLLRYRFPQAKAVVAGSGHALQTLLLAEE